MALRPTDIQVVLQATGDVGRMQQLQQQYSRQQQEHLAAYMQKNLKEKRKKTEPLAKAVRVRMRPISQEEKGGGRKRRQGENRQKRGAYVDIVV